MRWVVYILIILVFLPSALASITGCPGTAAPDELFDVTVSVPGSYAIGVDVGVNGIDDWSLGASDIFSVSYPSSATITIASMYKSDSGSSWTFDAGCQVVIEVPPDNPGTGTVHASTNTQDAGQSFWVEILNAQDLDGIKYLRLFEGSTRIGSAYPCGDSTSCNNVWWLSETELGYHTYRGELEDKYGNEYILGEVTVQITDPCAGVSCPDTDPCKIEECVAGSCTYTGYEPSGTGCGTNKYCDGSGNCQDLCTTIPDAKCPPSIPADGHSVDGYCASGVCASCDTGFQWDGNLCVADATCDDECADGETRCSDNSVQVCEYNAIDDCWLWGTATACSGVTPYCMGGECVNCLVNANCDNPYFGCEYRCHTFGACYNATASLCGSGYNWSSCQWDLEHCQCIACLDTESCLRVGVFDQYYCSETCVPGDCTYGCDEGNCVNCLGVGDCTEIPIGKHADCVEPTCADDQCSYPSTNNGGDCVASS